MRRISEDSNVLAYTDLPRKSSEDPLFVLVKLKEGDFPSNPKLLELFQKRGVSDPRKVS
jgi:hypothetical protein